MTLDGYLAGDDSFNVSTVEKVTGVQGTVGFWTFGFGVKNKTRFSYEPTSLVQHRNFQTHWRI